MADKTGISWTDATWNPIRGCSKVSAGCKNCYAEKVAARFSGPGQPYEGTVRDGHWNGQIRFVPDMLAQPLKWKRPRRIFVNSMSDLFHDGVPFEYVAAVFGVMAACPQHTFQVLTKRPARAVEFFKWVASQRADGFARHTCGYEAWQVMDRTSHAARGAVADAGEDTLWPLPNVHLGVSVENQETADARIPLLLQCPAAVHFVSYEPALGPVDFIGWGTDAPAGPSEDTPEQWADFAWPEWVPDGLRSRIEEWGLSPRDWLRHQVENGVPSTGTHRVWPVDKYGWASATHAAVEAAKGRYVHYWNNTGHVVKDDGAVIAACFDFGTRWLRGRDDGRRINWIIIGGESGPNARPFDVAWARSTIEQCRAAGVACFVKQLGARPEFNGAMGFVSESWKLKDKAGADPSEWPEDLRVQEFPEPAR